MNSSIEAFHPPTFDVKLLRMVLIGVNALKHVLTFSGVSFGQNTTDSKWRESYMHSLVMRPYLMLYMKAKNQIGLSINDYNICPCYMYILYILCTYRNLEADVSVSCPLGGTNNNNTTDSVIQNKYPSKPPQFLKLYLGRKQCQGK